MNGECTGAWRNEEKILTAVASVISEEDYQHIKQILTQWCLSELTCKEQESSKLHVLRGGNHKSVSQHMDGVNGICNKEDRYSH